jgi:PIN domain nuclease of toxin-antitoxin system
MPHLIDTHTLVWHLTSDRRLSQAAQYIMQQADAGRDQVVIPSICVVELIYLMERGRVRTALMTQVLSAMQSPAANYTVAALDAPVALAVRQVPRATVPDMPDRVIAATAIVRGLHLVTRDARLRALPDVTCVW